MSLGALFEDTQSLIRGSMESAAFGWPVVAGKAVRLYDCTSKNLDMSSSGDLLLSGNTNADSIDQRRITLNPADFTASGVLRGPGAGDLCLYQNALFQVKKTCVPETAFGTAIALPIEVFRAPGPSDTPASLAQNAKWPAPPQ